MPSDRQILKNQQAGALASSGAVDPNGEIVSYHTRANHIFKSGTENAATNVAETAGFRVRNKSTVKNIHLTTGTNVSNDATNYLRVYVYKRSSTGGSQTLLGSWNTATAAQGAITQWTPASFSLVNNTDLDVDAGSCITYHVGKFGSGQTLALATITVELESQ